jgi:DNA (cytosine-5)-methyltransferase 1
MIKEKQYVDTRPLNTISICSGYGGIELGLRAVVPTRVVCYVEIELSAAEILAKRMEEKALDEAPIWSNLRTFDTEPWRGKVDMLTGGFPCQPFSFAGKREQEDDERNLWPDVRQLIDGLGVPIVFLENVPGILRYYWETIRPELREMGYQVAEGLFTAAETGAPHKRQRLFILADSSQSGVRHTG